MPRRTNDTSIALLESMAIAGLGEPVEPAELLRQIAPGDLPILAQEARERNWGNVSAERSVPALRMGHHQLAQLLASGVSVFDASLVTGRSTTTIRLLQRDPAFCEIVEYYKQQQEAKDFDAYQRLVTLGGTAMEVLQERLEENPDKFSNNELRQLVESTMDRSAAPAKGDPRAAGQRSGGVNVAINFVPGKPTLDAQCVEVIEVKAIEESKS